MATITEDFDYEKNITIERATAQMRFTSLSDVHYTVDLHLFKGDWFTGKTKVQFYVKSLPSKDFWLDFRGVKCA